MGWFRSEVRARNFVLGFFGLVGICMILTIVGITVSATLRAPRTVDDFDPFVATGVAEMATYQAASFDA